MPIDIDAILQELQRPFPLEVLQLRVGATNREKTSGIALAYVHWWRGYLPVLNRYVGRRRWQIALSGPKGDTIAHLTAFDGAIQAWSRGEEANGDENEGTSSEIQAKRRVCAEGLGLGLYLYHLPRLWGAIEAQGRSFVFPHAVEEQLKRQLYAAVGLDRIEPLTVEAPCMPAAPAPVPAPTPSRAPGGEVVDQDRLSAARAALVEAERRAGMPRDSSPISRTAASTPAPAASARRSPAPPPANAQSPSKAATERQLRAILALLRDCRSAEIAPSSINRVGDDAGVRALAGIKKLDDLEVLTTTQASTIIRSLQAFAPQRAQAS